jgi:hypothetical protein
MSKDSRFLYRWAGLDVLQHADDAPLASGAISKIAEQLVHSAVAACVAHRLAGVPIARSSYADQSAA